VVCAEGIIIEEGLYSIEGSTVNVAPQSAVILHD
jgi:hypothetical protein